MIDRIEYHVQNAASYTDNAKTQTQEAGQYQVKARKVRRVFKVWIFLSLFFSVFFMVKHK